MSTFTKPVQLPVGQGIEAFHCGNTLVDGWAKNRSASARRRGSAVIYASYYDGAVAGFYTLCTHSVARENVDGGWFVRNSPSQVPAVLLGMMGVDEKFKGLGLGASSLVGGKRFQVTADLNRYLVFTKEELAAGAQYEEIHELSRQERMEEFMFLGLRKTKGISKRI